MMEDISLKIFSLFTTELTTIR